MTNLREHTVWLEENWKHSLSFYWSRWFPLRFEAGGSTSSIHSSFFYCPFTVAPLEEQRREDLFFTQTSRCIKPLIQNCNMCIFLLVEVLLQNLVKLMDRSWPQYVLGQHGMSTVPPKHGCELVLKLIGISGAYSRHKNAHSSMYPSQRSV